MNADESGFRLVRVSTELLVLTPIRFAFGLTGLGAAALVGRGGPALLAFGVGLLGAAIALAADPRYSRDLLGEVPPVPDGATYASKRELALRGSSRAPSAWRP